MKFGDMLNEMRYAPTADDLKDLYRRWAKLVHPDHGGNTEHMQILNDLYSELFEKVKNVRRSADGEAYEKPTSETPQEFVDIIDILMRMSGIKVELCGSWLWVSGDTKPHKDALKAAGCKWAPKKVMWSWHHEEEDARRYRGKRSMPEIRARYGSQLIKDDERQQTA